MKEGEPKTISERKFIESLVKEGAIPKIKDHTGQTFYILPGHGAVNRNHISNEEREKGE